VSAPLHAEIPDGRQHLFGGDLATAAGARFPVHFAGRLGPAHDSFRPVNGTKAGIYSHFNTTVVKIEWGGTSLSGQKRAP